MGKSQDLYVKAKKVIPGGTQLFSKRPEMFLPDYWPAYYKKAKGTRIWDLDGNEYIDMSYMSVGACTLGYADPDVNEAVHSAVNQGSITTLNCPEEVELAETLCELHPWAQQVRYARGGGEAMGLAVRIARAATGKDVVLFCGYHGWHDWYLSSNLADDAALDGYLLPGLNPCGVPRGLKDTAVPFKYNDTEKFLELAKEYSGRIAAVVIEPIRNFDPKPEFLATIRKVSKNNGFVMICDEVSSGWRLVVGGAHLVFDVEPDVAVFSKGISNGYPMAAVIGRSDVMEVAQETFMSSTYWTERIGPVAAIATIKKMRELNVPEHLKRIGAKVQEGWKQIAASNGITISVSGMDPLGHFKFEYEDTLTVKTVFTQLMLERGFLATNAFYASFAHSDDDVEKYLNAVDESFKIIGCAINDGVLNSFLKGPICHSGFKRLE